MPFVTGARVLAAHFRISIYIQNLQFFGFVFSQYYRIPWYLVWFPTIFDIVVETQICVSSQSHEIITSSWRRDILPIILNSILASISFESLCLWFKIANQANMLRKRRETRRKMFIHNTSQCKILFH